MLLRHGKVIQQGTHESLMEEVGGAYHALATAQQLDMGSGAHSDLDSSSCDLGTGEKSAYAEETDILGEFDEKAVSQDRRSRRRSRDSWRGLDFDDDDSGDDLLDAEESLLRVIKGPDQRPGRFDRLLRPFGSFGTLLSEQTSRWPVYTVILIGALGAGGQSDISLFQLVPRLLILLQLARHYRHTSSPTLSHFSHFGEAFLWRWQTTGVSGSSTLPSASASATSPSAGPPPA